jgi:hypothetical protein
MVGQVVKAVCDANDREGQSIQLTQTEDGAPKKVSSEIIERLTVETTPVNDNMRKPSDFPISTADERLEECQIATGNALFRDENSPRADDRFPGLSA